MSDLDEDDDGLYDDMLVASVEKCRAGRDALDMVRFRVAEGEVLDASVSCFHLFLQVLQQIGEAMEIKKRSRAN